MIPSGNSNLIGQYFRGIILQSQLYGRASVFFRAINNELIASSEGQLAIFARSTNATHFSLCLTSKTTSTNYKIHAVVPPNRSKIKLLFSVTIARFNPNGDSVRFLESMTTMLLLSNANVDSSYRISIHAAAAPFQQ